MRWGVFLCVDVGVWGGVVGRGEDIGCAGVRSNVFGRGEDVGCAWGVLGLQNGFLMCACAAASFASFGKWGSWNIPILRPQTAIGLSLGGSPNFDLIRVRFAHPPSPAQGKALYLPDESTSSRDKKQQHHRMLLFSFCMFCGCGLHLRFAGVCYRRQRMFRGFGLYQRIRIETGSSVTVRPSDRVIVDGVIRSL